MADNALKTPLTKSLPRMADRKALEAINRTGRALPCSVTKVVGAIVTVKFEVQSGFTLSPVTMPLFGPEYIRYPIQKGDKGFTVPADVYLGGMSGLGGGTADMSQRGNLSTLVFFPIGSKNWTNVDPNAVTIYGPNGVVFRDTNSKSSVILLPQGIAVMGQQYINIICGGASIKMTPTTVVITDSVAQTSPATMNQTWTQFINFFNSHVHGNGNQGASTTAPTTPYTGGNIAP